MDASSTAAQGAQLLVGGGQQAATTPGQRFKDLEGPNQAQEVGSPAAAEKGKVRHMGGWTAHGQSAWLRGAKTQSAS